MTEKSKKALLVGGGVVALLGVGWYVYSQQSADAGSDSEDFIGRRVASLSRLSPGGEGTTKGGRDLFKSSSKYAPLAAQIGQQA
jgi:hypothetical protein